jgi:hypothetical protein
MRRIKRNGFPYLKNNIFLTFALPPAIWRQDSAVQC